MARPYNDEKILKDNKKKLQRAMAIAGNNCELAMQTMADILSNKEASIANKITASSNILTYALKSGKILQADIKAREEATGIKSGSMIKQMNELDEDYDDDTPDILIPDNIQSITG